MATRVLFCVAILLAMSLCVPFTRAVETPEDKSGEAIFDLNEISVFRIEAPQVRGRFVRGQAAVCSEDPCTAVKAYPVLTSERPLYGSVRLPKRHGLDPSGPEYCLALDESKGTDTGYDRLYFDGNRNGDLTDDTPLSPQASPPLNSMLEGDRIEQQVVFSCLNLSLDRGPDGNPAPLEVMPRLIIGKGYRSLSFVTTQAHTGQIGLAGCRCQAYLGHLNFISGWFDQPTTGLLLVPSDPQQHLDLWVGSDRLMAMHRISRQYWQVSATPGGDRLAVRLYAGAFGTFEVGSGHRLGVGSMTFTGTLWSADKAVPVESSPASAQRCQVPVGDYWPSRLDVRYGPLRIALESDYIREGMNGGPSDPPVCGIQIRQDRPFVLDFANKPEVWFASPGRDQRVRRGETLTVHPVLVDAKLGIMVRDIRVLPREGLSAVYVVGAPILFLIGLAWFVLPRVPRRWRVIGAVPIAGAFMLWCWMGVNAYLNARTMKTDSQPERISPTVTITRSDGRVVAQALLAFG